MNDEEYRGRNIGKMFRRYRITRPGAKHVRKERASNGASEAIIYGCPTPSDDVGLRIRNTILLTEDDAKKYAFMQLVEVPLQDAPIVIKSSDDPAHDAPAYTPASKPESEVPDNWHTLPASERKKLASSIIGSSVRRTSEADKVLGDYVRDHINA